MAAVEDPCLASIFAADPAALPPAGGTEPSESRTNLRSKLMVDK